MHDRRRSTGIPALLPADGIALNHLVSAAMAVALVGIATRIRRGRLPLVVASALLAAHAGSGLPARPRTTRASLSGPAGRHLRSHITIAKPPQEVYRLWRNPTRLNEALPPRIHVEAVGPATTRWRLTSKDGETTLAEWTADLINDEPDHLLAWRTTSDGTVLSAGSVRFDPAPGDQGTEVRVHLHYAAPLGAVGAGLASLTPYNPALLLGRSLDHIKRHLELGRRAELTA
jgi:uncharacterized membrane protein